MNSAGEITKTTEHFVITRVIAEKAGQQYLLTHGDKGDILVRAGEFAPVQSIFFITKGSWQVNYPRSRDVIQTDHDAGPSQQHRIGNSRHVAQQDGSEFVCIRMISPNLWLDRERVNLQKDEVYVGPNEDVAEFIYVARGSISVVDANDAAHVLGQHRIARAVAGRTLQFTAEEDCSVIYMYEI